MHLRSLQMIFDENILPASEQYAVCADWKDDRNRAARLPAQEARLPLIQSGKEPEERVAQTPQQVEEESSESMICHQQGKLMREASPARTCGALEAFHGV
jgi:hypothetical protein